MSAAPGDDADAKALAGDLNSEEVRTYLAERGPSVHDPFAGGGSIPLEAQRLGLRVAATDLNPVALTLNLALVGVPPLFAGSQPIGPTGSGVRQTKMGTKSMRGAQGLAEDFRRYGHVLGEKAERQLARYYPEVPVDDALLKFADSDCRRLRSQKETRVRVLAWLWARTVRSPDPAFSDVDVPLVTSFILSKKKGQEAWIEPVVSGKRYYFRVHEGEAPKEAGSGTKTGRGTFRCLVSGAPISGSYIRSHAQETGLGECLLAAVVLVGRKRIFAPATDEMRTVAASCRPEWGPEELVTTPSHDVDRLPMYGMRRWRDAFTNRQLLFLSTLADLLADVRERVEADAIDAGWPKGVPLREGGSGALAYSEAIHLLLGLAISKTTVFHNTLARWRAGEGKSAPAFGRQAIPMVWDFPELNPFAGAGGDFKGVVDGAAKAIEQLPASPSSIVRQQDARSKAEMISGYVVNTDPPYYDNVGYADLSDFFYVWLRRTCRRIMPEWYGTMLTPKGSELVASPHRHGGIGAARQFFEGGMGAAIAALRSETDPNTPLVIYYAFKQSTTSNKGTSSTGWETFLQGVVDADLMVTGTWPVRTEGSTRLTSMGTNSLSSSIVLVARARGATSEVATRGDLRRRLRAEMPSALHALQKGNVAPVDMAQAAIGPGMEIFSRYSRVLDTDGSPLTVRAALRLINEIMDEIQGEEEATLDAATRFAATWFASHAYDVGSFGDAETLAKARTVSVAGVEQAGLLKSAAGKVRLLTRAELPDDWDPATDSTLTVWECCQHLIKRLELGETEAAALMLEMGTKAEHARILAYRLYTICERKNWAEEGRAYNSLVIAWPELERLAAAGKTESMGGTQTGLFGEE